MGRGLLVALVSLSCAGALTAQQRQSVTFRDFTITAIRPEDSEAELEITRNGKRLFKAKDWREFSIGRGYDGTRYPVGTDITGLGKPNAVIFQWTGGAHCCFVLHVLELGDRVRELATIDFRDAGTTRLKDLDKDGILEIESLDYTFGYWNTSFAESPAPRIIPALQWPTVRTCP